MITTLTDAPHTRVPRLLHYSNHPLAPDSVTSVAQVTDQKKPRGLWLSVGRAWPRWCEAEQFGLARLRYVQRVTVRLERVLWLRTARDIDRFTADYAIRNPVSAFRCLAWDRVASAYAGLLIAPFCWRRRLTEHTLWYSGWDCASACIWDVSAIHEVGPPTASDIGATKNALMINP